MDRRILGYFVKEGLPFLMESADRTLADRKGGHLARLSDGSLVLRELAQCPPEDREAFADVGRHRFFNTNSLWLNLTSLRKRRICLFTPGGREERARSTTASARSQPGPSKASGVGSTTLAMARKGSRTGGRTGRAVLSAIAPHGGGVGLGPANVWAEARLLNLTTSRPGWQGGAPDATATCSPVPLC